ncbi:helix-turn-helix transcriptional regulator [Peterkaempfera griseoplana]|uniref:helix-turn-helix transcriptional regulator n=1 Tax=Peterkaempfera griseoplana TaxID=66896 RepID=UPI0007C70523|nr:helix-turn-helix domain-containing protein [Peterkaempfera griseoplana]
MSTAETRSVWTFLTNHARVLAFIAKEPGIRLRDLAVACQVTERTVQGIVADLEAEGYLVRIREGRRNRYEVIYGRPLRHPADAGHDVDGLLALFLARPSSDEPGTGEPGTGDRGTDEPRTDEPRTDDPGTDEAGTGDRRTDEPGTDEREAAVLPEPV